jgi:hypothetical protein
MTEQEEGLRRNLARVVTKAFPALQHPVQPFYLT